MNAPIINYASLVIPTLNRLDQTRHAIQSGLKIPCIGEIIIVDDGSNFDLNSYLFEIENINDVKIKILTNTYLKGAQGARVTGVLEACSDIIIFLDSDDLLSKEGITHLFAKISACNNISLAYGKIMFGATPSNWLKICGDGYLPVLKNLSLCPFSGLIIRKSLINWSELTLSMPAWQDDDMCIIASKSGNIYYTDLICAHNSLSSDSISINRDNQLIGLSILLKKYKHEILLNFGLGRLFLWRIRIFSILLQSVSQDIVLKSNYSNHYIIRSLLLLIARIFRFVSIFINHGLRMFFDKFYG